MSEDLSTLSPTDPSVIAPNWHGSRKEILDGILAADAPHRRGRWVAAGVAAAVAVVAVGGIVQQLRPVQEATPASPTPPASSTPAPVGVPGDLVAVDTLLVVEGEAATLCTSGVTYSDPPSPKPQCTGIPVIGVSSEDLPTRTVQHAGEFSWDNVIVTGTFDGTTMTAVDVYGQFDPEAPLPSSELGDEDEAYVDLCTEPIMGTGPGDRPLEDVARELPGYQVDWPNGRTHNVAVTGDLDAAREALRPYVEREFCVGTVPGPSRAEGDPVAAAVSAVPGVEDAFYAANALGAWIIVDTLTDDESVKAEVKTVMAASMWPQTVFRPFFYPVRG